MSHDTVLLLIETYREKREDFKRPTKTKMEIWNEISTLMSQHLPQKIAGSILHKKWNNLMTTYKKILDNNSSTGRGRLSWPYFEVFQEIMGTTPAAVAVSELKRQTASNQTGWYVFYSS